MSHRLCRLVPALLGACLFSGCLESYEEDMVIHTDLSGTVTVKVTLPDTLASKFEGVHGEFALDKIRKRFASLSGVTLKGYTLTEGRFPEATFNVAFSSLEKLGAAAAANKPVQMLVGEFTVKPGAEGRTTIERRLGVGTATMEMPADKFAIYKTHFRLPVELSNTDSGFKDTSHNDVRYRWSLAEIASQKPSMINEVIKPWPWVWIFSGAAGLLVLSWIAWMTFGQKKVVYSSPREEPGELEDPDAPR